MLKALTKSIEFYVFSNLHIAVSSFIYVLGAVSLISGSNTLDLTIPLLVGLATFVVYNVHRLIGYFKLEGSIVPNRIRFVRSYWWVLVLIAISVLYFVFESLFVLSLDIWYFLIPGILLTALYLLPILPGQNRLRDLPFIKIVVIGIVWSGVFLIPLIFDGTLSTNDGLLMILFIEKLFFFLLITIPFDYRDREIDKTQNTATIATSLSSLKLKYLIFFCGAISILMILLLLNLNYISFKTTILLLLTYIVSIVLSIQGISERRELYYLGILDGLILVNGLPYLL